MAKSGRKLYQTKDEYILSPEDILKGLNIPVPPEGYSYRVTWDWLSAILTVTYWVEGGNKDGS